MLLLGSAQGKEPSIFINLLNIGILSIFAKSVGGRALGLSAIGERLIISTVPATQNTVVGRVLGLDVGSRRIGIAVSDPLGITAQGLETLQRKNKKHDLEWLRGVIAEYDVKEIVIGLPLRMSGVEGTQAGKMQAFAEELRRRFRLPVHLWDERLSSAEANRLLRETDLSIQKRGQAVDRMAAILILQGWMENRRASASEDRNSAPGIRLPEPE